MSAAETLATAAALIREQHGPDCPDHRLWAAIADAMDAVAFAARMDEDNLHRVGYDDVLRAADAFLASQPAPEVTR